MKINYKSDFKLIESHPNGDLEVPFRFTYKTNQGGTVVALHQDGNYSNCYLRNDGRLVILFDNHRLGVGSLIVTREYFVADKDFKDGVCNVVCQEDTGVEIISGCSNESLATVDVCANVMKVDSSQFEEFTKGQIDEIRVKINQLESLIVADK